MMTNKIMSPKSVEKTTRSQLGVVKEILKNSNAIDSDEKFSTLISSTVIFSGISREILSEKIKIKPTTILRWEKGEDFPGFQIQKSIICEVQKIIEEKIKELEGKLRPDTQE